MKISTLCGVFLLLVSLTALPAVKAQGEATGDDVALVSLSVTDVKLTHSVEGDPSKNWTVKVFVRNQGRKPLRDVGVSLTAWCGKAGKPAPNKRFLRRRRHSLTRKKRIQTLAPQKSQAIVFHVLTPKKTKSILFGALADCGKLGKNVTAAQAKAGKIKGLIDEGKNEGNNYKEQQAKH